MLAPDRLGLHRPTASRAAPRPRRVPMAVGPGSTAVGDSSQVSDTGRPQAAPIAGSAGRQLRCVDERPQRRPPRRRGRRRRRANSARRSTTSSAGRCWQQQRGGRSQTTRDDPPRQAPARETACTHTKLTLFSHFASRTHARCSDDYILILSSEDEEEEEEGAAGGHARAAGPAASCRAAPAGRARLKGRVSAATRRSRSLPPRWPPRGARCSRARPTATTTPARRGPRTRASGATSGAGGATQKVRHAEGRSRGKAVSQPSQPASQPSQPASQPRRPPPACAHIGAHWRGSAPPRRCAAPCRARRAPRAPGLLVDRRRARLSCGRDVQAGGC